MSTSSELARQLERRREQIAMPKTALASRAQVSLPTVNRILSGREQKPQLRNLEAIAKVLGVVVKFGAATGVEPVVDAFELRKRQATEKARRVVRMVQGTMGLESQAVDSALADQMIEQTVCELLAGSPRRLWSE